MDDQRPARRVLSIAVYPLPLHIQLKAHVSEPTRRELARIRELVVLALAQCSNDRNREKFKPGLIAYRDAIDVIAAVRPPRMCAGVAETRAA